MGVDACVQRRMQAALLPLAQPSTRPPPAARTWNTLPRGEAPKPNTDTSSPVEPSGRLGMAMAPPSDASEDGRHQRVRCVMSAQCLKQYSMYQFHCFNRLWCWASCRADVAEASAKPRQVQDD